MQKIKKLFATLSLAILLVISSYVSASAYTFASQCSTTLPNNWWQTIKNDLITRNNLQYFTSNNIGVLIYTTSSFPNRLTIELWANGSNLTVGGTTGAYTVQNPSGGGVFTEYRYENSTMSYLSLGNPDTTIKQVFCMSGIKGSTNGTYNNFGSPPITDFLPNDTTGTILPGYTFPPSVAPTAPTLTATDTNGIRNFSWTTPQTTTNYKLKKDGAVIYTGANNTFSETVTSLGQTNNYTVVAENSAGSSSESNTVTLTFANIYDLNPSPRDIKVISVYITFAIVYIIAKQFRYRG